MVNMAIVDLLAGHDYNELYEGVQVKIHWAWSIFSLSMSLIPWDEADSGSAGICLGFNFRLLGVFSAKISCDYTLIT